MDLTKLCDQLLQDIRATVREELQSHSLRLPWGVVASSDDEDGLRLPPPGPGSDCLLPVPPESVGALELVANERRRQMLVEGFTPGHDDMQRDGELALAGACYAIPAARRAYRHGTMNAWPWERDWWKPSEDRIRELTKAGALIVAEIERLQRAQARSESRLRNGAEVIQ